MTALFRPGPMEMNAHGDFSDIKNGKKKPVYYPLMEDITKETFSLYIYQEQEMNEMKSYMRMELTRFFPQAKVEYFV